MILCNVMIVAIYFMLFILLIVAIKNDWEVTGVFTGIFLFCMLIFFIINTFLIMSAKNSAQLYNKLYDTEYTVEDIYWNDRFIQNNLVGDKKNVNIKIEGEKVIK
jgi:ABC-type multidrug transport system fused ATPase/permease subunit